MMHSFSEYVYSIEKYGSLPAVTDATLEYTLTYRELCQRIYGYAHYLKQTQQCQPGDIIALYHLRGIEWVVAFFAAQMCDVTCISFDERMNDELCRTLIETTNTRLLIVAKNDKGFSAPCKRVSFGFKKPRESFTYPQSRGDVISEILLTSGTWSIPKGVTLTQQNILTNLHDNLQQFRPTSDDRLLSILPLSHAYAQMCDLFMPLYCGSQVVYTTKLDPQSLTSALRDYSITILVCVPRILESIHRSILRKVPPYLHRYTPLLSRKVRHIPLPARRALFATIHKSISPSLKTLAVGGAPLDPKIDTFFQALGYKVLVGYGLDRKSVV